MNKLRRSIGCNRAGLAFERGEYLAGQMASAHGDQVGIVAGAHQQPRRAGLRIREFLPQQPADCRERYNERVEYRPLKRLPDKRHRWKRLDRKAAEKLAGAASAATPPSVVRD